MHCVLYIFLTEYIVFQTLFQHSITFQADLSYPEPALRNDSGRKYNLLQIKCESQALSQRKPLK